MLLGNNSPNRPDTAPKTVDDDWIVQLISAGRYAEVYQLLAKEPSRKVSSSYNLALCLFFANKYEQALYRLDEALTMLRPAPEMAPMEDELYNAILKVQNVTESYRVGVTEKYVLRFPGMMKNNILRLKVDAYLALERWNKIIEMATLLKSKNYRNVEEALRVAEKFQV